MVNIRFSFECASNRCFKGNCAISVGEECDPRGEFDLELADGTVVHWEACSGVCIDSNPRHNLGGGGICYASHLENQEPCITGRQCLTGVCRGGSLGGRGSAGRHSGVCEVPGEVGDICDRTSCQEGLECIGFAQDRSCQLKG